MINPANPDHRLQLAKALDYAWQEIQKYNRMRAVTIQAYLGVTPTSQDAIWNPKKYKQNLPLGNLLQVAGLSHQIALAYGEPQWLVKSRTPENAGLAQRLGPALNRMSALLDLGEIHRNVAADSYFGYGVYKVGIGLFPPAARVATGLEVGPCIWRVGQPHFIYDITADRESNMAYVGDIYRMPVDDALRIYPHAADRLHELTDADRMDAPTVLPRPSRLNSPQPTVWLLDLYFPETGVVATWPIRSDSFGTVAQEPLVIREYHGHWSGVYQILNHLYAPDELVPIAQAESVKSMHFLFNDILQATAGQARNAKVNPVYFGKDKEMQRLWDATDRHPVAMTTPNNMPQLFEIPGPTQSQTVFLAGLYNFFKDFNPTFDDPVRAPTATQAGLDRQSTNAIVSEARRKDNRVLQLVGYKLGHLLLNNNQIVLPASRPLRPGSPVQLDVTFDGSLPHRVKIDDFDIGIEPYSVRLRTPEERLQFLQVASQGITQAMVLASQGAPVNVEKVIETYAELGNEPILREWFEPADPLAQAKRSRSEANTPRVGVGQYVRHNVSEKNTAGALEASLNGVNAENGQVPRFT